MNYELTEENMFIVPLNYVYIILVYISFGVTPFKLMTSRRTHVTNSSTLIII